MNLIKDKIPGHGLDIDERRSCSKLDSWGDRLEFCLGKTLKLLTVDDTLLTEKVVFLTKYSWLP